MIKFDYYVPSEQGSLHSLTGRYFRIHVIENYDEMRKKSKISITLESKNSEGGSTSSVFDNASIQWINKNIQWKVVFNGASTSLDLDLSQDIECSQTYVSTDHNEWNIVKYRIKSSNPWIEYRIADREFDRSSGDSFMLTIGITIRFSGLGNNNLIISQGAIHFASVDVYNMKAQTESCHIDPIIFTGPLTNPRELHLFISGYYGNHTMRTKLLISLYKGNTSIASKSYDINSGQESTLSEYDFNIGTFSREQFNTLTNLSVKIELSIVSLPNAILTETLSSNRIVLNNWAINLHPDKPEYVIMKNQNESGITYQLNYTADGFGTIGILNTAVTISSSDTSIIEVNNAGLMTIKGYTEASTHVIITITSADPLIPINLKPYTTVQVQVIEPTFPQSLIDDPTPTVMTVDLFTDIRNAMNVVANKHGLGSNMIPVEFDSGYAEDPRDIYTLMCNIHYNAWYIQNTLSLTSSDLPDLSTIIFPTGNTGTTYYWAEIIALWIKVFYRANNLA